MLFNGRGDQYDFGVLLGVSIAIDSAVQGLLVMEKVKARWRALVRKAGWVYVEDTCGIQFCKDDR
jgi:hypothetical protein